MAYPGPSHYGYAPLPAHLASGPQAHSELNYQPPVQESQRLRSVADLPECFRPAFAGSFKFFNAVQSETWHEAYESSMSVVLSAPTGSGKTVVMELAVLSLLRRHINAAGQFCHKPGHLKAIYLAPTRALVQEKVRDWERRFGPLGITCKQVTGDSDQEDLQGLDDADILCTTPEKFDAMTRRHRDHGGMRFFNEIALVLIDEVHLLTESRGAALEAGVISRIKMVSSLREMREQPIGKVRFVAVSATIPNIADIAAWLSVPPEGIKCFGEEMRPVKLRTIIRGFNPTKTPFLFERRLNDYLPGIIAEFSKGKPSLVFCSSRKGAAETAVSVAREASRHAERASAYVRDAQHHTRLMAAASQFPKNPQLKDCIAAGVGFHHAAMEPAERAAVEQLFLGHDLPVLCTTSTLAMGVNLPAHLVVLKGTRRYIGSEAADPSGYEEYERSTCLQMVGRAGRPQFDTEGVAVVMTQRQSVPRYEQLVRGSETVESTLKDPLPEYLNAEITLRTITDVTRAIDWLKSTFLYVRIRRSPAAYAVPLDVVKSGGDAIDRWLKERLILTTIGQLTTHGLVRTDEDGFGLEPLQPGTIMAENYIRLETMIGLCSTPKAATMPDLIGILASSAELSNLKLRRSEKKVLNEANHSEGVRHHVMDPSRQDKVLERISTGAHKVFILVNAGLADRPPDKLDYSLKCDMEQAVAVGARLAAAMVRYFSHAQRASETFNSLLLLKSLRQRLWPGSTHETRQLSGIGPAISERLAEAGVHSLRQLDALDPRRLETLAQRHFPFGNEVRDALRQAMPPEIQVECSPLAWTPGGLLDLEITVTRVEGSGSPAGRSAARLLVGTLHDNALLVVRSLCLESFSSPLVIRTRTKTSARGIVGPVQVVTSVVNERLLGLDVAIKTAVPQAVRLGGKPLTSRGGGESEAGPPPTTPAGDQPGGTAPTSFTSDGAQPSESGAAEGRAEGEQGGTSALAPAPRAGGQRTAAPVGSASGFMQLQQEQRGSNPGPAAGKAAAGKPGNRPAAPTTAAKPLQALPPRKPAPAQPAPLQRAAATAGAQEARGRGGWGSFVEPPPANPVPAATAKAAGGRAWENRPISSGPLGQGPSPAAAGIPPARLSWAAPAPSAASAPAVAPAASPLGATSGFPFSKFAFGAKPGAGAASGAPAAGPGHNKRSIASQDPTQQGTERGGDPLCGAASAAGQGSGGPLHPPAPKVARLVIPKLSWLSSKYKSAEAPGGPCSRGLNAAAATGAPPAAEEQAPDFGSALDCI